MNAQYHVCVNTYVDLVHNLVRLLRHESALSSDVDISLRNERVALWDKHPVGHDLHRLDIGCYQ